LKNKILLVLALHLSIFFYGQTQLGNTILGQNAQQRSGESLGISSDGNIVAVGASRYDNFRGSVKVFKNINSIWTQIGQTLTGPESFSEFGRSLSISSDGRLIAIGIPYGTSSGNIGKVKVYRNISDIWTQIGNDIQGVNPDDVFGLNIDLSSNGNIIAIGSQNNDTVANDSGMVRIFENIGNNWVQKGNDVYGTVLNNYFGRSLSLSSEGDFFAAGSLNSPSVKIYEYNGSDWTQNGNDIISNIGGDFGIKIDLSSDGDYIAISNPSANNSNNSGAVNVYKKNLGNWTQIGNTIEGDGANHNSGNSVGISSDGNVIAIGTVNDSENGILSGNVRIFQNIGNNWVQIGNKINGESQLDAIGFAISLSINGDKIAISAPGENNFYGNFAGNVRIYELGSILNITNDKLEIFKFSNPVKDYLTINSNYIISDLKVYSLKGNLILSKKLNKKDFEINLNFLSSGLYVLKVKSKNKLNQSFKILKL
jgi:Flp pilus assembly pilin Flp